ncbi:MAG: TIGR00282 family metallophosphoesterase [Peptococcaceae bacterium]|jgi:metallophosphoesterase (TIGR00282 family)|nr:TIGR00282 family metallophosphoesterase [Peptococcaceae bacterium]
MKILFIGDIVGKPGRKAIKLLLPAIQAEHGIDVTIANAENAAGGNGLTKEVAQEIYQLNVDFLTMGNHVWDQRSIMTYMDEEERLIRPANYPLGAPGKGAAVIRTQGRKVGVLNLSGRIFLKELDDPFPSAIRWITELKKQTEIIIVDFHAEATSEKVALGWFLDGKVSAVLGTHTHVQTADARILDQGTAYISDVGMTGPRDSVLGVKKELAIKKFVTQLPVRFEVAGGAVQLNGVVIDVDEDTGKARSVQAVQTFTDADV